MNAMCILDILTTKFKALRLSHLNTNCFIVNKNQMDTLHQNNRVTIDSLMPACIINVV